MKIKVFESFAGIGSQFKALELLVKEKEIENKKLELVGMAEWDINSLVAYHRIHRKELVEQDRKEILATLNLNEDKNTQEEIKDVIVGNLLEKMNQGWMFSNDTKTPLTEKSIKKMAYEKLIQFFVASTYYNNVSTVTNLTNEDYLNNLENIDIFTYSFPCQAISLQGKKEGLAENSDTSSSLLWQIKYFLEKIKEKENQQAINSIGEKITLPEYLLMENVAALFNEKNVVEWNRFKDFLESVGYKTFETVLKASHFHIPQNRDRAFGLSVKANNPQINNIEKLFLDLANKNEITCVIDNFLDKTLTKEEIESLKIPEEFQHQKERFKDSKLTKNHIFKIDLKDYTTFASENMVYHSKKSVSPTITAQGAQSRLKIYDVDNDCIRFLTSKEHLKLMGFEEQDYEALIEPYERKGVEKDYQISPVMIKKMAGNSIVVNVLKEIFKTIQFK